MHFAVVYNNADIAGIRTGKRPLLHTVHQTFDYCRDKTCVNSAAHYAVAHHEFSTPCEPVYDVEVMVPGDVMGDVMSDLQGRRAIIMGMTSENGLPVPRTVKRSRRLLVAALFSILFKELVLNVAGDKFV